MKIPFKKMTIEDKFARKYYCNGHRFISKMKHENRKKLRRLLKEVDNDNKLSGGTTNAQSIH